MARTCRIMPVSQWSGPTRAKVACGAMAERTAVAGMLSPLASVTPTARSAAMSMRVTASRMMIRAPASVQAVASVSANVAGG
jgi:hypothetical protein